ncbi:uncharacterized protein LOC123696724 [Colias croceus]|uniref:uncharacterized protein LOC123696724 n=1 Tax=Colias crocea TaxID=72248 RepID=UPI001E27C9C6|nr:uncharacterized protein LOC123696724 [Colias croceus]
MMKWQRCNYGQKLSKKEFSIIVGEVWRSLDPKILINGFKKGGIFPFNRTVVSEDKLDQSALKRWKEHKKNTAIDVTSTISSPATLLSICLKKINEGLITCTDASVTQHCHTLTIPSVTSRDLINKPEMSNKTSFEELLLSTIKRHESKVTIQKKTKISSGAEVITHLDVIKKLKQKEDEKIKKEDKLKMKQTKNTAIKKNSSKVTEKTTNFISGTRDSFPDSDNPGPSTSNHQLSMVTSSLNQETKIHNPKNIIVKSNIRIDDCSKFLKDLNKETMINISNKSILQLKKKRQDTPLSEITANSQNKGDRVKKTPMKSKEKKGLTKPKKQKIKIKHESSTDESDFSVHDVSDYENDNFDDYINSILVNDDYNLDLGDEENNVVEVQHYTQSSAKCSINDWVLVKFASKKTIKHFVGQVKSINNGVPTIKYARKIHKAKKDSIFAYPIIDDICDLKHSEDIVAVLPEPEISRRGHIIFKIHFDTYNVQ